MSNTKSQNVVVLAGGVGGAKLVEGLAKIHPPEQLTAIINCGDDFQHLGLTVCPDLDTIMYTLAGISNAKTGWGLAGETWHTISKVAQLGGPSWFQLGDLDLATHLTRTHMLNEGHTLTAVIQHLCQHLSIEPTILPMCDMPAPTLIHSGETIYPFQTWFVQERWQPPVTQVALPDNARASHAVVQALEKADIVLIAPSNPFVSVDPILNVYPIRAMLMDIPQAVVAVTPIIAGEAVKGPAAKMMADMNMPVTAQAVADHYGDLLTGFVFDSADEATISNYERPHIFLNTWMKTADDRARLAQEVLDFANQSS